MKRRIHILLADDTLLAREGWRHILETSNDVEIVGEAIVIEEVLVKSGSLGPDIVLLDLKWGHDTKAGLRAIKSIKLNYPTIRVVAISAYDDVLTEAKQWGADGALGKDFSRDELLAILHAVHETRGAEVVSPPLNTLDSTDYINRLVRIPPGAQNVSEYLVLVIDILQFLFSDFLDGFSANDYRFRNVSVPEVVASLKTDHPLWNILLQQGQLHQIVFEIRNISALHAGHVLEFAEHLLTSLIPLGVIITRNLPGQSVIDAAHRVHHTQQTTVLILSDEDLIEMLRIKLSGNDATERLHRIYTEHSQSANSSF